ncbi:hydroperoxide isomerase ALOXE3-like [Engraulis encrasicolus]|uniref:hydroperoxide isomerase ALOXE3-like n=1 Tax=Engraulis encrasicolus TaxID=184585 RepID=UPI002FD1CDA9
MVVYKVTVKTGDKMVEGTIDHVFITLHGTEGKSERKKLNDSPELSSGVEKEYKVECEASLGKVFLIGLEKEQYLFLPDDDWFCLTVMVKTPEDETLHFPCYSWVIERQLLLVEDPKELPHEARFSLDKRMDVLLTAKTMIAELTIKFLASSKKPWAKLDDIGQVFWFNKTQASGYVQQHWKEDEFFGYQFLNGANPMTIQRCQQLPPKFAVTNDMVQPFLGGSTLPAELQSGNIFLCDYSHLAEVPTNVINQRPQYVPSPFCLLFKNKEDKLVPIAIQLRLEPGETNPVFLPGDSEEAWLLAKTQVRAADFIQHQFHFHLLRTHLLAEAYAIATLRHLPSAHPLYKLLVPHLRYTLHVNTLGRESLISEDGAISMYTSTGREGMEVVMKKAMQAVKYSALCLPEDIIARGLEAVPNFYYRDDGLLVWIALNKYVEGVLAIFYPSDADVSSDEELQGWIEDIYKHGFLEQASTGIPSVFSSVKEVTKFVTMVIFTMTAQHSALNSGQFDFGGWLPNCPNSLQSGAPCSKDQIREADLLLCLPDVNTSVWGIAGAWLASKKSGDFVPLAQHPEQYFSSEPEVQGLVDQLREDLKEISQKVQERNKDLKDLPYTYLDPENIENSVTI